MLSLLTPTQIGIHDTNGRLATPSTPASAREVKMNEFKENETRSSHFLLKVYPKKKQQCPCHQRRALIHWSTAFCHSVTDGSLLLHGQVVLSMLIQRYQPICIYSFVVVH